MTQIFNSRVLYAVTAGDYSGQYILPITQQDDIISCLTLPDNSIIHVPKNDYSVGIKNKLLEKVADLEEEVYNYLYEVYKHESNNN